MSYFGWDLKLQLLYFLFIIFFNRTCKIMTERREREAGNNFEKHKKWKIKDSLRKPSVRKVSYYKPTDNS